MEYLQDYGDFNPRTKLDAIEYVNNNYYALKQIMNLHKNMELIKIIWVVRFLWVNFNLIYGRNWDILINQN
jgi:hypothetical protein